MMSFHAPEYLPLRGSDRGGEDRGEGRSCPVGFTHHSIHTRLPAILDQTIAHNPTFTSDALVELSKLRDEVVGCAKIQPLQPSHPDSDWREHAATYVKEDWDTAPWWFVENYFYRRLLDAIDYWTTGADPFLSQKRDAIRAAVSSFQRTVLPLAESSSLEDVILRSLWGNRADLSLSSGKSDSAAHDAHVPHDHLLVDNTSAVIAHIEAIKAVPLEDRKCIIVLDNCGLELLTDLVLADALLRTHAFGTVVFHVKAAPVFVSDAMVADIREHVEEISKIGGAAGISLANRLNGALASGALQVLPHDFYTTAQASWDMPVDLRKLYSGSQLVIIKGDANYRRLLGDRHWPHATPFTEAVSYFPAPLLCLRTCKAGLAVGIPTDVEERVKVADADWCVSGKYGVVQFKP